MGKQVINRLSAFEVARLQRGAPKGARSDGGGLFLFTKGGAKSWVYRFSLNGRRRDMGLGSVADVSLAEARALATKARKLRAKGIDPIAARNSERAAQKLETAQITGRALASPADSVAQLYRHFDKRGRLLYVGVASNHLHRLRDHRDRTPWFHQITVITIEHFSTMEDAEAAEYLAITEENPLHNIHGGTRVTARRARVLLGRRVKPPPQRGTL